MERCANRIGDMRMLAVAYLIVMIAWLIVLTLNAMWLYKVPVGMGWVIVPTFGWLYFTLRTVYFLFTGSDESSTFTRSAWITYGFGVFTFVWSLALAFLIGVLLAPNEWDAPSPEFFRYSNRAFALLFYFAAGFAVLGPVMTWLATRYVKRRMAAGLQPESR